MKDEPQRRGAPPSSSLHGSTGWDPKSGGPSTGNSNSSDQELCRLSKPSANLGTPRLVRGDSFSGFADETSFCESRG